MSFATEIPSNRIFFLPASVHLRRFGICLKISWWSKAGWGRVRDLVIVVKSWYRTFKVMVEPPCW